MFFFKLDIEPQYFSAGTY